MRRLAMFNKLESLQSYTRDASFKAWQPRSATPFDALGMELLAERPCSKQEMQNSWSSYAHTSYLPQQPKLFSEWPLIATNDLQHRLQQRLNALVTALQGRLGAAAMQATPWKNKQAADVLTVDFALVKEGDTWDLRLVECQTFTSLLVTGFHVHQVHQERWPSLASTTAWDARIGSAYWLDWCRRWVAGEGTAAILEHQPWQRGTLFDLHASSVQWGLPLIEPHQLQIDDHGALFSEIDGQKIVWQQILNRLILNEIDERNNFVEHIAANQCKWHSHPAWYDLVQKGVMAEIDIEGEPACVDASNWRALGMAPQKLVAKNKFSCAGKQIYIGPSAEELDALTPASDWLVQPRFEPYAIHTNQRGEQAFAEIRLIVRLEALQDPMIAMQLVRVYYGQQASASFFQGREGEGVTVLHRPL